MTSSKKVDIDRNGKTQRNRIPPALVTYLEQGKTYQSLSVRDLLEARDAYHVFLTRKTNVVGTAIGKYRVRKKGVTAKAPRTLENSEVQAYSWPCVLVFVDNWVDDADFGKETGPSRNDYLPRRSISLMAGKSPCA